MSVYATINILDMIKTIGEDCANLILSNFSCPKNYEIETFVRKNAIDFAKRKMSITHLIMNDQAKIAAIFTLTHKAITIQDNSLSATLKKKIKRYAQFDEKTNSYIVSAFLIAQFGKNYAYYSEEPISGNSLMDDAIDILTTVQHNIGGGLIYLECEDKPQLLSFYQNDNNCFRVLENVIQKQITQNIYN